MSASSCISSSAGDNGSDLFVLRYWHDLKNNCPETYRVQPQYQYYLGGTITNKWDSCQTLTSFASHRWTYEFNYVTGNGAKYMSNWRTC